MTPDEARGHATRALVLWGGGRILRLCALRENAVFEVALPDGRRAALRLHRAGYQTDAAIRSEMAWTRALADDGFPCPTPVPDRSGDLLGCPAFGPRATLVDWIDAVPFSARRVENLAGDYERLGRLLADLHAASDRIVLPAWFDRPRRDAAALTGPAPLWGAFWRHPVLSPDESRTLERARAAAAADLEANDWPKGLIHADALMENVLGTGDGLHLIDFDDGGPGYRHYDLGCALVQHLGTDRYAPLARALSHGYAARATPVDPADLALFAMLRAMASLGWLMSRAPAGDPRHRAYADRALAAARAAGH